MNPVAAAERLNNITFNTTEFQPMEISIAAAIVEQLTEDAATNPNVRVEIYNNYYWQLPSFNFNIPLGNRQLFGCYQSAVECQSFTYS